jgi:hypothetical protein
MFGECAITLYYNQKQAIYTKLWFFHGRDFDTCDEREGNEHFLSY